MRGGMQRLVESVNQEALLLQQGLPHSSMVATATLRDLVLDEDLTCAWWEATLRELAVRVSEESEKSAEEAFEILSVAHEQKHLLRSDTDDSVCWQWNDRLVGVADSRATRTIMTGAVAAGAAPVGAPRLTPDNAVTIILSVLVGGVTLTGSLVAWAKL